MVRVFNKRKKFLWCLVLMFGSLDLYAYELLQPGAEVIAVAGNGVITSEDSSSLFHNPANIAWGINKKSGIGLDVDLRLAHIRNGYFHPEFGQHGFNVTAPMLGVGTSYVGNKRFAVGVSFFPTGTGSEVEISGVPVDITRDDTAIADIYASDLSFRTAIGGAFRVAKWMSLGLSVVHFYDKKSIFIDVRGAEDPLVDAEFGGSNFQPRLGARLLPFKKSSIAFLYKHAMVKQFSGSGKAVGESADVDRAEYMPMGIGLGVKTAVLGPQFWGEYLFEQYSAGRSLVGTGFGDTSPKETNYQDAHNLSLGSRFKMFGSSFGLGIGYMSAGIGAGEHPGQGGKDNLGVAGMQIGSFEGLDRYTFGATTKLSFLGMKPDVGFTYLRGIKKIPDGKPGQGVYETDVIYLTYVQAFGY